jgi:peroxiredoxin Q/BCP
MSSLLDDFDVTSQIKVGVKAPDFALVTEKGENWRLSDYYGNVIALLFYPKNETLVCTRQMCSVRNHWADYLETKATIVGISPGTIIEHQSFSNNHRLPLSILADADRAITGLYTKHWILPLQFTRAIIVVDAKGIIRYRQVMLRAFRPTDKSVIASIYAARTDFLYEHYNLIKSSYKKNTFSKN